MDIFVTLGHSTVMTDQILILACPDKAGIVAAISGLLFEHGCFVTQNNDFGDPSTGRFFMRVAFRSPDGTDAIRTAIAAIAGRFAMEWRLEAADRPLKTLLMVSRFGHCLNDLLYRWKHTGLPIAVTGVVSNHETFRADAQFHGLPFHYLPVTATTKAAQEEQLKAIIAQTDSALVVLARYMQVLSPDMCRFLTGRAINIHHSFLPSFKGARPYHQAYERGVKLIGATAHFVTEDLDEGPIIEQAVERVDHTYSADELVQMGHDIESRVLSRAVRWIAERRVMLNGRKTVVFR